MELRVHLEAQAVLGEPKLISGWVCGIFEPAQRDSSVLVTDYCDKWLLRRMINGTQDFLLDYINLRVASERGSGFEKQLCSVVAKHGVLNHKWSVPAGLPPKCADFWRRSERYGQVPFALPQAELIDAAKEPAAMLELFDALKAGNPIDIVGAQAKLGYLDRNEQVMPDFGLSNLASRVTNMLTHSPRTKTELTLRRHQDGTFVMTIAPDSLKSALFLSFCDQLASTYRRCKTCARWFPPKGDQIHCTRQCRTRSSVYRLRALDAVKTGMTIEEAAKRYGVPISELGDRIRNLRHKSRPRKKAKKKHDH